MMLQGTAFADIYLNGVKLDTSDFTQQMEHRLYLDQLQIVVSAFGTDISL